MPACRARDDLAYTYGNLGNTIVTDGIDPADNQTFTYGTQPRAPTRSCDRMPTGACGRSCPAWLDEAEGSGAGSATTTRRCGRSSRSGGGAGWCWAGTHSVEMSSRASAFTSSTLTMPRAIPLGIVTGEVGAGKTLAARAAIADLDPARHTVLYIPNPDVGVRRIRATIVPALAGYPPAPRRGFSIPSHHQSRRRCQPQRTWPATP